MLRSVHFYQKIAPALFRDRAFVTLAIIASAGFSAIPTDIHRYIKGIAAFLNGSPKGTEIFRDFQDGYQDRPGKITRYGETRWLSRYFAVTKLIDNFATLMAFFMDHSSEKIRQAEELLEVTKNPLIKAYLLFLWFALEPFSRMTAYFQSEETSSAIFFEDDAS